GLEGLVGAKGGLEIDGARGAAVCRTLRVQSPYVFGGERRNVALHRLGAERHAAIEPDRDLGRAVVRKVAAERRRDLESELEVAAAEAAIQLLAAADRRPLVEIARASRERLDPRTPPPPSILAQNPPTPI